ncbi:MAG: hypothetical protein QF615_08135, partial [Planctomycetota bacterium]|nr:hypothetical protein [Planctomycetota bacterium]
MGPPLGSVELEDPPPELWPAKLEDWLQTTEGRAEERMDWSRDLFEPPSTPTRERRRVAWAVVEPDLPTKWLLNRLFEADWKVVREDRWDHAEPKIGEGRVVVHLRRPHHGPIPTPPQGEGPLLVVSTGAPR